MKIPGMEKYLEIYFYYKNVLWVLRNFPEWLPPNVNMKDWGKTDVSSGYLQLGKFSACKISFRLFKGLYWLCNVKRPALSSSSETILI